MKNLLLALLLPTLAYAQDPGSADGPQPMFPRVPTPGDAEGAPPGAAPSRERGGDGFLRDLPPEIRKRFEAARAKAMQDPKVQELRKKADAATEEFRAAMREAMKAADPELAEMFRKFAEKKMQKGGEGERKPPGFGNLSEGERQKLAAARDKAKSDPAVAAAAQQKKAASTPAERAAAGEAYHKAMRDALLRADPSLAPLLDQLRESGDGPRGQRPPGQKPDGDAPDGMMEPSV